MRRLIPSALLFVSLAASPAESAPLPASFTPYTAVEGAPLLGKPAPAFRSLQWLQGTPQTLQSLRGHPVLIRFFTTGCSLCTATAPTLNSLYRQYAARGLVVIGIHHPKEVRTRAPYVVRQTIKDLGFEFPIAMDNRWRTLKAYGVGTLFQQFTSITVLIDKQGIIRFVHDGGEIHPSDSPDHADCNSAWLTLDQKIQALLGEGAPDAGSPIRGSREAHGR